MPTGAGKTAVLMATPYVLRAKKVLILTPSRLVREQIVDDFTELRLLRVLGATPIEIPAPRVLSVRRRISALRDEFEGYDVVVGIPSSIVSAEITVSRDEFDLILVDEAHHSPAVTWRAVLGHFSEAKMVLFTATPFRRDRREVIGDFVYEYPLGDALKDGVFGRLEYHPVDPGPGENPDVAVARAAAGTLQADRREGLNHRIMVRTGRRNRAEELVGIYRDNTSLNLEVVLGSHSMARVKRTIRRLEGGELDGIVCVDMLGEGFDFPMLKIAALHTPHKSLPIVLQFIGRFARTTGTGLGRAAFFAVASEMRVERQRLYQGGAAWEELIPNLAEARVREERHTREVIATFRPAAGVAGRENPDSEFADISIFVLRPYHHVKILEAAPGTDITQPIDFPSGYEVVIAQMSAEHSAAIYVLRRRSRPEWSMITDFDAVSYELCVIYHQPEHRLVFICSSLRTAAMYQHLGSRLGLDGSPLEGVSQATLNRVLLDLTEARFFNVGMKNTHGMSRRESYRTLAGPAVDQAIAQSDARSYKRGHWFGSAKDAGVEVTIGLSSASKVWSNATSQIPQMLAWCDRIAAKLRDTRTAVTQSGLDFLTTGRDVVRLPENIAFIDWPAMVYRRLPRAQWSDAAPDTTKSLLDHDIYIVAAGDREVEICIRDDEHSYSGTFSLDRRPFVLAAAGNEAELFVQDQGDVVSITDYLNEYLPPFYTADLGALEGRTFTESQSRDVPPFDAERIETEDWGVNGVDIEVEFGNPTERGASVHAWLERRLMESDAGVVVYDHGPGEVADFISIRADTDTALVTLYHCKAAGGGAAGARVADVYEVSGQVAKSIAWGERRTLMSRVGSRLASREGRTRLIKGNMELFSAALDSALHPRLVVQVVALNPGISKAALSPAVAAVLAAADDFVARSPGYERIRVIGSL